MKASLSALLQGQKVISMKPIKFLGAEEVVA
jgi:hypothetical protein